MTESNLVAGGEAISLSSLPRTALQAIYHAVTGKTENLSKDLKGNVVIGLGDFERLYAMLREQMEHYQLQADPTVTVTTKCENDKTITYSSWERFKALRVNNHEVTSEIALKVEFILQLPGTIQPQRCVIVVSLDSALPLIQPKNRKDFDQGPFGLFLLRHEWNTDRVSIDFVDFLVAKIFTSVVEEWFKTLKPAPKPIFNKFLAKNYDHIRTASGQFGRIGMAIYLATYFFISGPRINLPDCVLAVAVGLLIWGLFIIFENIVSGAMLKRILFNVIPTVILITDQDNETYDEIKKHLNSALTTASGFLGIVVISIGTNLASSYLYSWLTHKP